MTSRKKLKRKAAQSVNHLMNAVECILELKEIFEPDHPEYAKVFKVVVEGIGFLISELTVVYAKAWGYFPEDLSKWMH